MDLKEPGNLLYLVGTTRTELGGSLWPVVHGQPGGTRAARRPASWRRGLFRALHEAIGAAWSGAATT